MESSGLLEELRPAFTLEHAGPTDWLQVTNELWINVNRRKPGRVYGLPHPHTVFMFVFLA